MPKTSLSGLVDSWIGLPWPGDTKGLRGGPYPGCYVFDGYAGPEHFDVTTDNGRSVLMRLIINCIRGLKEGRLELELTLAKDGWEVLLAGRRCAYSDPIAGLLTLLVDYLDGQDGD